MPFVATGEGESAGDPCPSMKEVAAALQRDANDGRSLELCGRTGETPRGALRPTGCAPGD